MIWLFLPIFDWSIIMIGPSGLLLVVPAYLSSCMFAQFHEAAAAREECNKYDLTGAPHLWFVNHTDWPKWFAISNFDVFVVLYICSFWWG
jgi:hypothetical protein